MTDLGWPREPLEGRLAARAVTLARDATNAPDDVVDHLLRLAGGEAAALERAAAQVERHPHHPRSATAELAVRSLQRAASVAGGAQSPDAARMTGAVA